MLFDVGAPPTKQDQGLLSSLKRAEIGGYAPNPRKTRRYQVEDTRAAQTLQGSLAAPRFLSEKARQTPSIDDPERRMSDVLEALNELGVDGVTKREVPVMYRNVEIKYSRFGVDDFDFEFAKSPPWSWNQLTCDADTSIRQDSRDWRRTS